MKDDGLSMSSLYLGSKQFCIALVQTQEFLQVLLYTHYKQGVSKVFM